MRPHGRRRRAAENARCRRAVAAEAGSGGGGDAVPIGQQRPAAADRGRPGPRRHRRPPGPGPVAAAIPAAVAARPAARRPGVEHPGRRGGASGRAELDRCRPPGRGRPTCGRAAGRQHPQRRQRVVGQQPRPDEVPHRRHEVAVVGRVAVEHPCHPVAEHPEEQPAAALERGQHRPVQRRHGQLARLGQQQRRGLGGREHQPAVPGADRAGPGPDHLARRGELVEQGRGVAGHPAGQHQRLERRRRHRRARQPLDRLKD